VSDNYVQNSGSNEGTTTASVTLNGVVAGNAIVAFLGDGNNASPTTHTVSDAQGSYTAKGSPSSDGVNGVWIQVFLLENANAGTHNLTGTVDTGNACFLIAVEVGTTTNPSYQDAKSAFQSNPGTGTDALTTAALTITAASTIVALCNDSGLAGGNPPVAGTGFTSRGTAASTFIGDWRLETGAFASNHAATATAGAGTGGSNFITTGIGIVNGGAAATIISALLLTGVGT
jgi:hypothetical protein